jgi:hypothetical protein
LLIQADRPGKNKSPDPDHALLFGSEAGTRAGMIKIKDRQLAQWLQELDNVDEETRSVVVGVLKLAVNSSKAKKLLIDVGTA